MTKSTFVSHFLHAQVVKSDDLAVLGLTLPFVLAIFARATNGEVFAAASAWLLAKDCAYLDQQSDPIMRRFSCPSVAALGSGSYHSKLSANI